MRRLGFSIEKRSGVVVIVEDDGGVAPANMREILLWNALIESKKREESLENMVRWLDEDEDEEAEE